MTKRNRIYQIGVFAAAPILLLVAACSDDDGPSATPTSVAVETTTPANTPTAVASPVLSPEATPGPAATIELAADPQQLVCDGVQVSMVTATVKDVAGVAVPDGTDVTFSVQALGTADPIDTETTSGEASTSVVALGQQVGVVVNVTSGGAAASIRVDCQ